jgi:SAM-dependent methyltransferase
MTNWKTPKDWYSIDLEQRKQWYLNQGDNYEKTRPNYDSELVQKIIQLANFNQDSYLLEIGCGTGKATTIFADFSLNLLGLEPNPEFYAIASKNCSHYERIKLENISFEEWQPKDKLFDGVMAANAFHWLPPDISYPKSHQILKAEGYLILLWNLSLHPPYELYQEIKPIYQKLVPSLDKYETLEQQQEVIQNFGEDILKSGLFSNLTIEQKVCHITYSVEDYLTLLSTYSPYIALKNDLKLSLFSDLKTQLMKVTNGYLPLTYLSATHLANKVV